MRLGEDSGVDFDLGEAMTTSSNLPKPAVAATAAAAGAMAAAAATAKAAMPKVDELGL